MSVMTLTFGETFFCLVNTGTQYLVLADSSFVSGLRAPVSQYSPIVVIREFECDSAVLLSCGCTGAGILCSGALTPCRIA